MVMELPFLQTVQSISFNSRTASTTVRATFVLEIRNSATMNMSASSVKESLKVKAFTQSPMGESMTVSGRTISTGQEMNTVKGGSWLEDILKGSDSR